MDWAPRMCARCGAEFGCGADTGSCWCASVDVPPDVLRALDERYDGCLCPGCLKAAGDMSGWTEETVHVPPVHL